MLTTGLLVARLLRVLQKHHRASVTMTRTKIPATGKERWQIEVYAGGVKLAFSAGKLLHRVIKRTLTKIEG